MTLSLRSVAICLLSLGAALLPAGTARAQAAALGVTGGSTDATFLPGMTEVFARIDNPSDAPLKGELVVRDRGDPNGPIAGHAAFSVAPKSSAILKVPANAEQYALQADVIVDGTILASKVFSAEGEIAIHVVEAFEAPRVKPMIDGLSMMALYSPLAYPPPPGTPLKLHVSVPFIDPATGSAVLPSYAPSWQGVHLVIIPSSKLDALPADELQALYGHILAGGTLAIAVTRPEDLRQSPIVTLAGAEASAIPPPDECFTHIEPPVVKPDLARFADITDRPPELVRFTSYSGGNLVPSVFGASAPYGLGEVVVLGFDPYDLEVAKAPWAQARLADLARRAHDRFQKSAVRPGFRTSTFTPPAGPRGRGRTGVARSSTEPIEALLDPNSAARWSIGIASLIICGYAVLAGPVNFGRAKKKNKPLHALLALPIFSIGAFLLIVIFGFVSKGVTRRSNRLTFVEVGAGMDQGASRRFRAFFSPFAQSIEVRPTARTNMLDVAGDADSARRFEVDGDGLRMGNVESMPAQTMVVREDGVTSLGGSVAITHSGEDIVITNRLKQDLRAVIVHLPNDQFRYQDKLAAGASVVSTDLSNGNGAFESWAKQMRSRSSAPPTQTLDSYSLKLALKEADHETIGDVWYAVDAAAPPHTDWFPIGVPVVLALVDGGSGDKKDSGVRVVDDWLVLRVVGFGGEAR